MLEDQSGSQAATPSTIHSLGSAITTAGVYELVVDASDLVNGEALELRFEERARTGDTNRQSIMGRWKHILTSPLCRLGPVGIMHNGTFSLEQVGGSSRTFEWSIRQLDG